MPLGLNLKENRTRSGVEFLDLDAAKRVFVSYDYFKGVTASSTYAGFRAQILGEGGLIHYEIIKDGWLRNGDTLVVRWVDRLGRNYQDVCDTIREFMRRGVLVRR